MGSRTGGVTQPEPWTDMGTGELLRPSASGLPVSQIDFPEQTCPSVSAGLTSAKYSWWSLRFQRNRAAQTQSGSSDFLRSGSPALPASAELSQANKAPSFQLPFAAPKATSFNEPQLRRVMISSITPFLKKKKKKTHLVQKYPSTSQRFQIRLEE